MPTSRDDIVAEARSWVGTKWRHQGRSRVHGVDCAGLVIAVAHELGLSEFDIANYRREPRKHIFIQHFRDNMHERAIADRLPGDVLLLRDRQFTCHAAILAMQGGRQSIIHAFAGRRQVVEEDYSADWRGRTTQCFAFPGLDEGEL